MLITLEDWQAEAIKRFSPDPDTWVFVCPSCDMPQSRVNFLELGLPAKQVDNILAYACIRRWMDQGCMASGNGPTELFITEGEIRPTFAFA